MAINIENSIANEVSDFFISLPNLEDLANYKVSQSLQDYIDSLVDKNNQGDISPDERLELEKILAISHLMSLAKTKAKLSLGNF